MFLNEKECYLQTQNLKSIPKLKFGSADNHRLMMRNPWPVCALITSSAHKGSRSKRDYWKFIGIRAKFTGRLIISTEWIKLGRRLRLTPATQQFSINIGSLLGFLKYHRSQHFYFQPLIFLLTPKIISASHSICISGFYCCSHQTYFLYKQKLPWALHKMA